MLPHGPVDLHDLRDLVPSVVDESGAQHDIVILPPGAAECRDLVHGQTRRVGERVLAVSQALHVVVLDDLSSSKCHLKRRDVRRVDLILSHSELDDAHDGLLELYAVVVHLQLAQLLPLLVVLQSHPIGAREEL